MAIARTQYITIAELNEILGVSTYTVADTTKVYEASELVEYNLFNKLAIFDTSNAPDKIKLATAYQVLYNETNSDDEYQGSNGGFSLGKFSTNETSNDGGEYRKLSPKTRRYLVESGYMRRVC